MQGCSEEDDALLRMLGGAPPDQWGACLQGLGASLRRVDGSTLPEDSSASTCTISSLLTMLEGKGGQDCATSAGPTPTSPSPAKRGARARAKKEAVTVSSPTEEDSRDLEELLRDLGEKPAPRSTKASRAAQKRNAKPGKSSREAPEATMPPAPPTAS